MTPAWTTDAATDDPARAVRLTLFWGLEGVCLRTIAGGRVPTVTEGPLRRRLNEADLPVVALDPGLFEGRVASRASWLNEIDQLDEVAAFGARFGCQLIRVGALSDPDGFDAEAVTLALRQVGERAERLGLALAVRNEAGTAIATGAALAGLLAAVDHPAVGADWRPADALMSGEAPGEGLAALGAANVPVWCVGVRDGWQEADGWGEAEVGAGTLGWDAHLGALVEAGVDAPLVIDVLPMPPRSSGLASATALVRALRLARRSAAARG